MSPITDGFFTHQNLFHCLSSKQGCLYWRLSQVIKRSEWRAFCFSNFKTSRSYNSIASQVNGTLQTKLVWFSRSEAIHVT